MLRLMAPIRFATAKTVVAGAVAGGILFGSQLVMAAAPSADFDFTPGVGRVGQPVSFSASTEDPDADIVSVEWDFENDGSFDDAGQNVQHTYLSSGTRTVRMVVTDATSDTAVVFDTIRVNAPPNAAFHFSPSSPTAGEQVSFDGSDSTDDAALADGSFDWDFDADGAYDDASGRQVGHSFSTPGTKPVGLRVTDSEGDTSTDSDTVSVAAVNSAPDAAFSFSPPRPNPNQGVAFDASGTSDDGPLLPTDYAWDLDGDGQFDDALGVTPTFTYASDSRTVSLRVTDVLGVPDTVSHTVTVNAPPSASFVFSPNAPEVGQTVGFDASGSGDDLSLSSGSFGWDFDNNGSIDATGAEADHAFPTSGVKTVRLQVTDSGGLSTSTTRNVPVSALNTPPLPSFIFSPARPNIGQTATFDAGGTTDDESIPDAGFDWDFDGNGSTDAEGRAVGHAFSSAGARTVSLRVTDADGASATTSRTVTVNAPPDAAFSFTPTNPDVGDPVSFNAAATTDDLALAGSAYAWDLNNDGAFDDAVGQTAATTFTVSGGRVVRLQVTDSGGSTDVATQTVSVAANPAPTAAFTFTPARPNVSQTITYNAAGSTDDEPIPATGYAWDLDGDLAFDDATGVAPTGSFATAGAKTVRLQVTDADGAVSTAAVPVTVNAPPTVNFTFTPTPPLKGVAVNFTATASDDLALPAAAYTWDLDGNNTFGDGGFTGATASTIFATAGAKTVRVRVTDSGGSATTVAKTVNVNTVPVADFTVNPQTPRLGETVTFTSTSTDADAGQTLAVAWDLDADGQFDDSTAANPTRAFPTEGEKVVRLRVTDSVGSTHIRERRFEVQSVAPVAGFTSSPAAPLPGQTVTFTSTATPSPGSVINKIEWKFDAISGFVQGGSVATYAFRTAGRHTVELKVTDSNGVDIATAEIVVNAAPTALIRFSPSFPYAGDVVDFASLSRDPDGYLASETWDLDGDGQFDDARGKVASKAFATLGAHTVRLRVVDGSGAGAVHAVTLNVRARPVPPPPAPEQLDATVRISSRPGKGSTLITRLGVRTSRGATVRASCKGKGCPRGKASSTRSRGKALRLRSLERRLWAGSRIRIYVTAKGKVGSYTTLLIRRSKLPSRKDLCLAPGTTRTMRCPS
jgi:large repetitive protein